MSNHGSDLPIFPTTAPSVFSEPDVATCLFTEVLENLAEVVDISADDLERPTPCVAFTVGQLRTHVLGWLEFFAAALGDPTARTTRPDPDAFVLPGDTSASTVVGRSLADIGKAIGSDTASQLITMNSSRMAGDGVLAMALGEYIIHGWDLATATGRPFSAPEDAVIPAHEFLTGMVAPEYRGPDSGFFDTEVSVPDGAEPLDQLLGFAGRDPHWKPAA